MSQITGYQKAQNYFQICRYQYQTNTETNSNTHVTTVPPLRPGKYSGLSGTPGFGSEIFCENAVVATQEIVIVPCESLECEFLTEKKLRKNVVYINK